MQACNERERAFVWFYVTNNDGNAAQAARDAGYSDPGGESAAVRVQAHALMHRDRVLAAIDELGGKAFRGLLMPAIRAARRLIENEKHSDHAKTVLSTLSRLGKSERTGIDVNLSGEVTVNHTDSALADLRALIELGASDAKLVEIFGFSGLSRYRKMLAEQDRKRIGPPVVDAEFSEVKQGDGT